MVALAVQQLQADSYAMVFSNFLYAIQPRNGIARAFLIRHSAAVSRKCDDVRYAGFCRRRDVFSKRPFNRIVVFRAVQCIRNRPATGIGHRADESVTARDIPVILFKQINAFEANLRGVGTKLIQRNMLITPAANGLMDAAFPLSGMGKRCFCSDSSGKSGFQKSAAVGHDNAMLVWHPENSQTQMDRWAIAFPQIV